MRLSLVVCAASLLVGCSTKYGEMGFSGGVNAQRIDDRTVRVSGRGNGYTPGYTVDVFKPGQDVFIRMYSEQEVGPQAPAGLYDAAEIKKYLGPKYIKES